MGEIVNRSIVVNIVSDDVHKAQETLLKKQKALNDEIKKTNDPKALADFNKQLKATEQQLSRNEKVLKGELLPTYNQLTAAVKKYYTEFKKTGDPEVLKKYTEANALLKQQKTEIKNLEAASTQLTKGGIFQASFWANLAANGIARVSTALSNFLIGSVSEALDADEATQRLSSTLSNLGRTDAFDRLTRKAQQLADKFRFLDNDDIVAVFNKLIDYGKLTEKEMNNLLPVIIDFAAKSKISIEESSSVIIKALEGNGKALKEYGINVKDGGDETERLNIIMTTLKDKVDGAGEAFQNTAKGGLAVARQELKNLQEQIGNGVIPAITQLVSKLVQAGRDIKTFFRAVGDEFKGKNGFIRIALDEVNTSNPAIKTAVDDIAQQTVEGFNTVTAAVKILGSAAYKQRQQEQISFIKNRIAEDQARIAELQKSSGREGQREAKDLLIGILGRQQALVDIEGNLNPDINKTLGIKGSSGKDKSVKPIKDKTDAVKKLNDELLRFKNIIDITGPGPEKDTFDAAAQLAAELSRQGGTFDPSLVGINEDFKRKQAARLADLELEVQTTRGRKKRDKQIELLNEQEKLERDAAAKRGESVELVEENFRKKRKDAELDYFKDLVSNIQTYASQVLDVIANINDSKSTKENAELDKDRRINDKKIKNLDARLRKGIISQQEYQRQVDAIEAQQQAKEKKVLIAQFNRDKKLKLIQAVINTAEAVTEALPNVFLAAIAGAAGAAQIAAIASQKPPQFAKGSGPLGGQLHSDGGNAIVNKRGQKIAEIERGEAIINRHSMADRNTYTVSGTPSQIASQINSMHGRGVSWTTSPKYMNYGAINKRYYATGGLFENTTAAGQGRSDGELTNAVNLLNHILMNNGINVSLDKINKAQTRLDGIISDATLK